jgi:hypothetical protein
MAKRQDILTAMKSRFQGIISGSSGYQTQLGQHVFVWRTAPLTATEVPCINIRDIRDDIIDYTQDGSRNTASQHQLTVDIEILVSENTATIEFLRTCHEDLELAISTDEYWGGLALRTVELSNEIMADQEANTIAGMLVTLRIDFRTKKFSSV